MLVPIGVQGVEADAVVQRQVRQQLPLVLQIDAVGPGGLGAVVDDGRRRAGGLEAMAGCVGHHIAHGVGDQRDHLGARVAVGPVPLHDDAAAKGVARREAVGALHLQAAGRVALVGVLRDAVEEQVAQLVRAEHQGRIAPEQRRLQGQLVVRIEIGRRSVGGALALPLVQSVGEIVALAVHQQRSTGTQAVDGVVLREARMHAVKVRDLEGRLRGSGEERESAVVVQDVVEIGERLVLIGRVVQGRGAVVRRLDADAGVGVAA